MKKIDGANHAHLFKKTGQLNYPALLKADAFAKLIGPILNLFGAAGSMGKAWLFS